LDTYPSFIVVVVAEHHLAGGMSLEAAETRSSRKYERPRRFETEPNSKGGGREHHHKSISARGGETKNRHRAVKSD
jgi:hypothetical protein